MRLFIILMVVLLPTITMAGETELPPGRKADDLTWHQIKKSVSECFGYDNYTVELAGGVEHRIWEDDSKTQPFAEARISVPLFDYTKKRQQKRENALQMAKLADLFKDVQKNRMVIGILQEKRDVLKKTMLQDGTAGIEAYYSILEKIVTLETETEAQQRKLMAWVEICGDK